MKLSTPKKFAAGATLTLATCLLASCNAGASSTSSAGNAGSGTTGQSPSPSTAPVSETFTSPEYGYTVTLPAGWTVNEAHERWDGSTELDYQSFGADQFTGTSFAASFGVAAKWKHGLASYTRFLTSWNARTHSDYCPGSRRPCDRSRSEEAPACCSSTTAGSSSTKPGPSIMASDISSCSATRASTQPSTDTIMLPSYGS